MCEHEDISVNDFQIPYKVYCFSCRRQLTEEEYMKLDFVKKTIKENKRRNSKNGFNT